MKKKRKSSIPKHKRMKRDDRLRTAEHWLPKYEGKDIIKGYSKRDGLVENNDLMEDEIFNYSWIEDDKAIYDLDGIPF